MSNLKTIPTRRARMAKYAEMQARRKAKAKPAPEVVADVKRTPLPEKVSRKELKGLFYI